MRAQRSHQSKTSFERDRYTPRRVAMRLSYDGTDFHGWQRQPDQPLTLQETLERVLTLLLNQEIIVEGASRTDAGVHAEDQLIAFTYQHPISLCGLVRALNNRLPPTLATREPTEVPLSFQPRFANAGKRYRYQIYSSPSSLPLLNRYATHTHHQLDLEAMVAALDELRGVHDFTSFAASNGQHTSTVRDLFYTSVRRESLEHLERLSPYAALFTFHFAGDGFMKYMVRNLVGTLLEVGRGHWSVMRVREALEARDRRAAGPTAPARGLCLEEMFWNPSREPTLPIEIKPDRASSH